MEADPLELAYRQHADELIRYATVLVGPDDAPDVVTDAMVRVFNGVNDVTAVTNLRALLYRAVFNAVVDQQRSSSRRRRRESEFEARRGRAIEAGLSIDARAALRTLTVQQRTIVFLTYWGDQSPADVAAVLGVSEGTVRKQLARARARLREVLDE